MHPVTGGLPRGAARPRADAQRNAERLLAAARSALDEQGLGITTRDLATRAGVGLGTLYRRVPSVSALLAGILGESIEEMTEQATEALHDTDPWHGFAAFAETFVQLRASSCGLHAALSGAGDDLDLRQRIDQLRDAFGRLIRHAQAAHAVRGDIDWRDVPFALAGAIPADHTIGLAARSGQWRRNLQIILDGLRAPARG